MNHLWIFLNSCCGTCKNKISKIKEKTYPERCFEFRFSICRRRRRIFFFIHFLFSFPTQFPRQCSAFGLASHEKKIHMVKNKLKTNNKKKKAGYVGNKIVTKEIRNWSKSRELKSVKAVMETKFQNGFWFHNSNNTIFQ